MTLGRLHPGHAFLLALALAAALLGWRLAQVAAEPLPAPPPFSAPALADRSLLARFDPFFPSRGGGKALPVTALPFSLHGVRADSATGRGSAIIASAEGQQQVYAVGETIADGVTLAAIAPDHVVLERAGVREALWLDSAGGEAVPRYDPTASEPLAPAVADPDGNVMPLSDAPAPAAVPRNPAPASAEAAVMPAAPPRP
jgi:general secretion pathway protein C